MGIKKNIYKLKRGNIIKIKRICYLIEEIFCFLDNFYFFDLEVILEYF